MLKLCGELGRRQIAETRMRTHLVEVFAPGFDDDLGLGARPEPLHVQALVAEFAVEALQRAVLPRLAEIDQGGLDAKGAVTSAESTIHFSSARDTNSGPLSERR